MYSALCLCAHHVVYLVVRWCSLFFINPNYRICARMSHSLRGLVRRGRMFRGQRRWLASAANSTTLLTWPLAERERLSSKLLEVERHWKQRMGDAPSQPSTSSGSRPSKYVLAMFPYPSGALHMGHLRVYTISDVIARYYRLTGNQVIHPIGWDAFGLPAENAARERGVDPTEWTKSNIESMRGQLLKTGVHFDWDREINTSSPEYYRWTQWIFTKMFRAGLVRRGMSEVNWDPVDETVLAAEQIDAEGKSWRSGAVAEKRRMHTWLIETPKYAKRLSDGLTKLHSRWHEVAEIQDHWIGTCDVHRFMLPIEAADGSSTREFLDLRVQDPLSLPNAAFVLLSAMDSLVRLDGRDKSQPYVSSVRVLNGVTGAWLPLVVVPKEYLDGTSVFYGGVAPMYHLGARLSHAEADANLAATLGLPLCAPRAATMPMTVADVEEIAKFGGFGGYVTSRTLMDWAVSRQRAWGTPIPMILGEEELAFPVADSRLPVTGADRGTETTLASTGRGRFESDTLDTFFDSAWYFLRFLDPKNEQKLADEGLIAKHMPVDVYVGGVEHAALHLYYARFFSYFLSDVGVAKWSDTVEPFRSLVPQGTVRWKTYVEPGTGRYVRESDVDLSGRVPRVRDGCTTVASPPPGTELTMQYEKMSKSKYNGVDPEKVLDQDGVDMARLQLLDTAAPRAPINWGDSDLTGLHRWVDRMAWVVGKYVEGRKGLATGESTQTVDNKQEEDLREVYNFFVRNTSMTIEVLHLLNTAIARLQGLTNALRKTDPTLLANSKQAERCIYALVTMLQVFAPHTAAELHAALGLVEPIAIRRAARVDEQAWPALDADATIDFSLHINGVNCGRVQAGRQTVEGLSESELLQRACSQKHNEIMKWLLEERAGRIEKVESEAREGLYVLLRVECVDGQTGERVSEEEIRQQMDAMAAKNTQAVKEEKKRKRKGLGGEKG